MQKPPKPRGARNRRTKRRGCRAGPRAPLPLTIIREARSTNSPRSARRTSSPCGETVASPWAAREARRDTIMSRTRKGRASRTVRSSRVCRAAAMHSLFEVGEAERYHGNLPRAVVERARLGSDRMLRRLERTRRGRTITARRFPERVSSSSRMTIMAIGSGGSYALAPRELS